MGKRNRASATTTESAPPKKKARRAVPTKPVEENASDSDDSIQVIAHKSSPRKKVTRPAVDSEDEGVPQDALTPEPNSKRARSNSTDDEENIKSPVTRKKKTLVVSSDSDEEERPKNKKRLRRVASPVVDEDGEPTISQGRLRRKTVDEDKYKLDSDDEDLLLPLPSSSSKPTKRQVKAGALERYARARKNRSSPAPVPSDAPDEDGALDFDPIPEVESDEEEDYENLVDEETLGNDFIVDEGEDADATAALDRMRYSHRDLEENFAIFVEYMAVLNSDPQWSETASEDDTEYFATAVASLRKSIEPLADTMTHTTWKAPFICTLNLRPFLQDGVLCDRTGNCHACWTRGMYSCDIGGSYQLSTRKGVYDPETFQKKKEKGLKYGTQTSFENNAEARNLPYPPQFKLYIGKRCFNRALAYHEVRHYLYNISVRVKEKIEQLCSDNEELENDVQAQLDALKEEKYIDYLWGIFKADKKRWGKFANRKDSDVWG
ncbi:hypothetical protein C8F01DRAFT_1133505 [Mycena amicta]|nr:hypothetical protein C8F01DRAFT_1133505 [Mycena amicta]